MTNFDVIFVAFSFANKQCRVQLNADLVRDLADGDSCDHQVASVLVPQIQWQVDSVCPWRTTENSKELIGKDIFEVLIRVSRMAVESMSDSTIPNRRLSDHMDSAITIFNGSRRVKIMRVGYKRFPMLPRWEQIPYQFIDLDPV